MGRLAYGLGMVMLVLAGASLVAQGLYLITGAAYRPVSLLSIWDAVQGSGAGNALAGLEASLGETAGSLIKFVLTLPAWISLSMPGAVLALLFRPRERAYGRF